MHSRLPKVLHPLCGQPMISHVVSAARDAGFGSIVVVVPPDGGAITEALGDSVACAVQRSPLGGADAVLSARASLPAAGTVAVLCGDVPLVRAESLSRMQTAHAEAGAKVTLLTARVNSPSGLGRVVRGPDGGVAAVVEEADADARTLALDEINAGIYMFDAEWLWEGLVGPVSFQIRGTLPYRPSRCRGPGRRSGARCQRLRRGGGHRGERSGPARQGGGRPSVPHPRALDAGRGYDSRSRHRVHRRRRIGGRGQRDPSQHPHSRCDQGGTRLPDRSELGRPTAS